MKALLRIWALLLTVSFAVSVAGCAEEKGPMEKFGESIDEGVEEVKDEVDDAT